MAERALALAPKDLNNVHTLACILVRLGDWPAASPLIRRLVDEGGESYLGATWDDMLLLFQEAVHGPGRRGPGPAGRRRGRRALAPPARGPGRRGGRQRRLPAPSGTGGGGACPGDLRPSGRRARQVQTT